MNHLENYFWFCFLAQILLSCLQKRSLIMIIIFYSYSVGTTSFFFSSRFIFWPILFECVSARSVLRKISEHTCRIYKDVENIYKIFIHIFHPQHSFFHVNDMHLFLYITNFQLLVCLYVRENLCLLHYTI